MSYGKDTMSLTCGDSMLEGMSGGMIDGGMSPGAMMPDGMLAMMQNAMAGMSQMMQGGMMDGGMTGGFMGPWMLLVPLVVLIGLVALAVWVVRALAGDSGGRHSGSDALQVARERYARGEIDREEFERIRADLTSG